MIFRCDLSKQYERHASIINEAIKRVLDSGIYTLGKEVQRFEENFAKYSGTKYSVGVANGTDALILSLKALGIQEGDEVITTPFTAIPTVSAIIATGATPVFVDIEPDTFLMSIPKIENALTRKTKAVIPVHLFGNVIDVERIKEVVGKKLPIIEDACQAHGSRFKNKMAGSIGISAAFSFYPTKNLGAYGDGGIVVTNSLEIQEKIRLLRMYGMKNKDTIVFNGINSRLDEIQAAILNVKLRLLDQMNLDRQKIADRYKIGLNPNYIEHQTISPETISNYHVFCVRCKVSRNKLIEFLGERKIQSNIYYSQPIHLQPANHSLGYRKGDFPISEQLCDEIIALPMYPELEENLQDEVICSINHFFHERS